jgi:hypothetical protein
MGSRRHKSGAPNLKDYESEAFVQKFDAIRHVLIEQLNDNTITNRALSLAVGSFLQFQEEYLGRDAKGPRPFTKLPIQLFQDFEVGGALQIILLEMYKFKDSQGWRRFDFNAPNKVDAHLEMFAAIERALIAAGKLKRPVVYFAPEISERDKKQLVAIVLRHGGTVTDNENEATHIIKPDNVPPEEEDVEYLRTIERRDRNVLVHWWYYPDSYDTWLPINEIEGEPEEPKPHTGKWMVTARYLIDLDYFNEWMNELDYEYDPESGNETTGVTQSLSRRRRQRSARKIYNDDEYIDDEYIDDDDEKERYDSDEVETSQIERRTSARLRNRKRTANEMFLGLNDDDDEFVEIDRDEEDSLTSEDSGPAHKRRRNERPRRVIQTTSTAMRKRERELSVHTTPRNTLNPVPNRRNLLKSKDPAKDRPLNIINITNFANAIPPVEVSHPVVVPTPLQGGTQKPQRIEDEQSQQPQQSAAQQSHSSSQQSQSTSQQSQSSSQQSQSTSQQSQSQPQQENVQRLGSQLTLVLPPHASWFDISRIDEREKRALPEFFTNNPLTPSKTPQIYKEYRDFMIYTYQQNPSNYLTVTACRRNLAGDAAAIIRVHDALEHWGLINYAVSPDTMSLVTATSTEIPDVRPDQQVLQLEHDVATTRSLYRRLKTATSSLTLHPDVFPRPSTPLSSATNNTNTEVKCNVCGADCSQLRYESQRHIQIGEIENERYGYNLCAQCYADGKYPEDMFSSDFVKIERQRDTQTTDWTDQETLLLLEGIEKYGENWDKVAEHVATKSREECILHFLRLPIEEPFLEDQLTRALHPDEIEASLLAEGGSQIPFISTPNPILTLLTFLTQAVQPEVAAAAAQAALETFAKVEKEVKQRNVEKITAKTENVPTTASNGNTPQTDKLNSNATDTDKSKKDDFRLDENDYLLIKKAAAAALGAAALKARMLAEREEREIEKLMYEVIDAQLQKLEIKMKCFDELEEVLKEEQTKVERAKQQLSQEKLNFEEQKRLGIFPPTAATTTPGTTTLVTVTSSNVTPMMTTPTTTTTLK